MPENSARYLALSLILMISLPLLVSAQPELDDEIKEYVRSSKVADISIWFAKGGDIDLTTREGNTLLMMASRYGDLPTINYLLSQRPDVNAQNRIGATALMMAAKYGHTVIVESLLQYGADPTLRTCEGYSASRFALVYRHPETYKVLMNAENIYRRTHS